MRAIASLHLILAACRRGLVLLTAVSFLISGMASIHTAHALSGGHNAAHALPATTHVAAADCDADKQPSSDKRQDKSFSCCAFACAPVLVLGQTPGFGRGALHGDIATPPQQRLMLSQGISGLFRPPRQNA